MSTTSVPGPPAPARRRTVRPGPALPSPPLPAPAGRGAVPDGGRVLVLSATVGQGHEGAARELAARLRARGVHVEVRDYLDALPPRLRWLLRDLYSPTVQHAPALFEWIFRGLEGPGPCRWVVRRICRRAEAAVASWTAGADVVVSTYPLASQTLGALRTRGTLTVPAVTYLTDPAPHAFWCHPAVDHHLSVTRATAVETRRYGVPAVASGPLCAVPAPVLAGARAAVRAELGIAPDAPVALLSAGSLGMGDVPSTVRDLTAHPDPALRVVVLCGRNEPLRRRLARNPRVVALGWRDDVHVLMAAADVLVHNAGGLSLTEALAAGLPALTYRPIAGHGRANAAVLARSGIAAWPGDAAELATALDAVLARGRADAEHWPAGADPSAHVHDLVTARAAARAVAVR